MTGSATFIVALVCGVLLAARVLDFLASDDDSSGWRSRAQAWWLGLHEFSSRDLRREANGQLLELFDVLYGPKFWSWKRWRRSALFSVATLLIVAIVVDDTLFATSLWRSLKEDLGYFGAVFIVFGGLFVNILPDTLSLAETKWVLKKTGSSSKSLIYWVFLDLLFTAVIFLCFGILFWVLVGTLFDVHGDGWFLALFLSNVGSAFRIVGDEFSLVRPFFLSTFGTSILWWLFLSTVFVVSLAQRGSLFLRTVLKAIIESDKPTTTVAGFICGIAILIYGVIRLFVWYVAG